MLKAQNKKLIDRSHQLMTEPESEDSKEKANNKDPGRLPNGDY